MQFDQLRRREFITLAGSAAAWPLAARAQQSAVPVIGFLSTVSPGPFAGELASFKSGLAETGFVEGRNIAIEYRWAENQLSRLPSLAADLVKRQVSVLVSAGGLPSARAAQAATSTIPIVFTGAGDPIRLGFVKSLHRPGGNMTGVSFIAVALAAKRLEILREIVSTAAVVAVLSAGRDPHEIELLQDAAATLGVRLEVVTAASEQEFDKAFAAMKDRRVDAALIGTSPTFVSRRADIVALASRYAIPSIYARREYVADGGLISYSPVVTEAYRQVGIYTGRIVKGEKPAELPVQQPTRFELAINLKTAKALGLEVPATMIARADEVIE